MTDPNENQDTVIVAEYTLGLMDPAEAKAFAIKLTEDSKLRAEYIRWTEHFSKLSNEIEAVEPPAHLKANIHKRLFGEVETTTSAGGWFNLRWAGALAFTCVLAIMLYINMPATFTPTYTAQLSSEENALNLTALYDENKQSLKLASFQGTPAPGRDFELWLIVAEQAPVSLGVMTSIANKSIMIPSDLAGSLNGATLALSDEPLGGSPTGSPTGAVLVAGTVQAI